jgi:hypothetical protein
VYEVRLPLISYRLFLDPPAAGGGMGGSIPGLLLPMERCAAREIRT